MNKFYQTLEEDIKCLPHEDYLKAKRFIDNRDIESIYDVINACYKMKLHYIDGKIHDDKWKDVDANEVCMLLTYIITYINDSWRSLEKV